MRKSRAAAACLAAGVCFGACAVGAAGGCKRTANAAVPPPQIDQAKQFVATLKSLPASQRPAYAQQHQDQVQNLNRAGDPEVMNQFLQLMRPAGPR